MKQVIRWIVLFARIGAALFRSKQTYQVAGLISFQFGRMLVRKVDMVPFLILGLAMVPGMVGSALWNWMGTVLFISVLGTVVYNWRGLSKEQRALVAAEQANRDAYMNMLQGGR